MTGTQDFPLTITRTLNAPRDLVWACYSELKHLKKWWGPVGFEWIKGTLDFRPGGMFHYGMRAPNGTEMWGRFVYQAIAKPETIDFINSFSDPAGGIARPPYPGMERFPREVMNHMIFEDLGKQTELVFRGGPHNATSEERKFYESWIPSMNQGFSGTFAQLESYLETLKG